MAKAKSATTEIIPAAEPPVTTLALPAHRELTPSIWRMITEIAPSMYKSRLFGVTTPEAAEAIMLKGYELGLSITASFEFVQVIQGKPALSPRGAMALLLSNPLVEEISQPKRLTTDDSVFLGYEVSMKRKGGFQYTAKFTLEDAVRASLLKPDSGWAKYPENMCLWRAIGFCADVVFPDVTAGMTTLMKAPEMYGVTLTEGGDVIVDAPSSTLQVSSAPLKTVNDLLERTTAEKILELNNGKIPATQEEIEAVWKALES